MRFNRAQMALMAIVAWFAVGFSLRSRGRDRSMYLSTLYGRAFYIGLMMMMLGSRSVAAQVTCSNCPTANRPVCTDRCVFLDAFDYTLNGVQLMLKNPEILTRLCEGGGSTDAGPGRFATWKRRISVVVRLDYT